MRQPVVLRHVDSDLAAAEGLTPAQVAYLNAMIDALQVEMNEQDRLLRVAESERDRMHEAKDPKWKLAYRKKAQQALDACDVHKGRAQRIVDEIKGFGVETPGIPQELIGPADAAARLIDGQTRLGAQRVLDSEERKEEGS